MRAFAHADGSLGLPSTVPLSEHLSVTCTGVVDSCSSIIVAGTTLPSPQPPRTWL